VKHIIYRQRETYFRSFMNCRLVTFYIR